MISQLRGDLVHFRQASQELAEQGEALAASGSLPADDQMKLLQITNASTRLRQLVDGYRLEHDEGVPEPKREMVEQTAVTQDA
jgi:hypothetical protein